MLFCSSRTPYSRSWRGSYLGKHSISSYPACQLTVQQQQSQSFQINALLGLLQPRTSSFNWSSGLRTARYQRHLQPRSVVRATCNQKLYSGPLAPSSILFQGCKHELSSVQIRLTGRRPVQHTPPDPPLLPPPPALQQFRYPPPALCPPHTHVRLLPDHAEQPTNNPKQVHCQQHPRHGSSLFSNAHLQQVAVVGFFQLCGCERPVHQIGGEPREGAGGKQGEHAQPPGRVDGEGEGQEADAHVLRHLGGQGVRCLRHQTSAM